ncbi:MAG: NAD-dependent deacylase [Nitrospiraceae bacterium]|nr:MAG: NAD-dependent deacylase [Nitrospiraceae bacterium]
MDSFEERISRAVRLIGNAGRITAFTGAGISTESGISDFRSTGGIWARYRIVTYQEFIASHEARVEYWHMKHELFSELKDARPNRAHYALAELERMGRLTCLVTQNIDGLHQDAGSSRVIEIHGTNRKAVCLGCGNLWPIEEIQMRVKEEGFEPRCEKCRGFIKPATVSFGQPMPEQEMARAHDCAVRCDLFIMIGSSLQVEPAASLPREAHRSGAGLIYANRTETPTDSLAAVVFREGAGDVMESLLERIRQ